MNSLDYDYVVGIPAAAEPIAEAFVAIRSVPLLHLAKEESETGRRILPIINGEYRPGQKVLMIDDLISTAHSKIEAAGALRSNSLVVEDCVVLLDYELGGKDQLTQVGIRLHAVMTVNWLLDIYHDNGMIDTETKQRVINYRREVEEYMVR